MPRTHTSLRLTPITPLWRHLAQLAYAMLLVLAVSAFTSWVLINWLVGCGEIDPAAGYVNLEVCFAHPLNWR